MWRYEYGCVIWNFSGGSFGGSNRCATLTTIKFYNFYNLHVADGFHGRVYLNVFIAQKHCNNMRKASFCFVDLNSRAIRSSCIGAIHIEWMVIVLNTIAVYRRIAGSPALSLLQFRICKNLLLVIAACTRASARVSAFSSTDASQIRVADFIRSLQ